MCVMCAVRIPKHFPSRCPTEIYDSAYTWPSICYKCKPFIPIHDHERCPNAKSLACSSVEDYVGPKMMDKKAIKIREKHYCKNTLNSRKKSFKTASDGSLQGTTFFPQKAKRTFVQKSYVHNRPNLPPMASFMQPMDGPENCDISKVCEPCAAAVTTVSAGSNRSSCLTVDTDNASDYTLPCIGRRKNYTYTTQLDFSTLEDTQKYKRHSVGAKKISKKVVKAKAIKISSPSIDLISQNDVETLNFITDNDSHHSQNRDQEVVWNDLSLIHPEEPTNAGEQNTFEVIEKENKNPKAQISHVITNVPSVRATVTTSSMIMDSDSEVDLFSSNDEEDVLVNDPLLDYGQRFKLRDTHHDVKACSLPQLESPDTLSKKVLSCISPVDKMRYDHSFVDQISSLRNLHSSDVNTKLPNDKCKKKRHQLCHANKKTQSPSSILDDLQFLCS